MTEVESQLSSEDLGKDLTAATKLLKKHQVILMNVTRYSEWYLMLWLLYTAFRLAYHSPQCRFDGDFYTTAQAPLATEEIKQWAASSQPIDNLAALPTAADRKQLTSFQFESNDATVEKPKRRGH